MIDKITIKQNELNELLQILTMLKTDMQDLNDGWEYGED